MARSRDYTLLKEVWVKWRDVVGKPSRVMFSQILDSKNYYAQRKGEPTFERKTSSSSSISVSFE